MRRTSPPRRGPYGSVLAPVFGLLALVLLAGCYHRTVRAEGLGTQTETIYEPNLKEDDGPFDPPPKNEGRWSRWNK